MTGDLFRATELPIQHARPDGVRLIGPYARQRMDWDRIKFWFAMIGHREGTRRYELAYTLSRREPISRYRGGADDTSFRSHALPADLSPFPSIAYPRHAGDKLELAMQSMLCGEDLADAVRLTRFGIMPERR